jgi:branched-chain amino acid transport system permease protein
MVASRDEAGAASYLMDILIAQLLTGLAYASTLFLVSAGLTIIFGVTRVVNFAHGSLYMLGAYAAYTITARLPGTPLGFFGGLLLAAAAVAIVGVLIEVLILRRIYESPEIFQLLATFGVVLIVQDLALWLWGPEDLFAPRAPGLGGAIEIAGAFVPQYTLLLLAAGPLVFAALWWLFRRTRWGIEVRAATSDGLMASALGVNRGLLFTTVFALGAFLAGLAGALQIPRESVTLQMDLAVIVEAFVVVVVGGLGSIPGAFLASLLIGLLHAFGVLWLPKSALVLAFVAMALVLIVRPFGLLGRAEVTEHSRPPPHAPYRPAGAALKAAWALALLVAASAPLWASEYTLVILTEMATLAVVAASLHFFMSHGGITSFGHAAFFGLGAYGAALAVKYAALPFAASLLLGPLVAGVAALAAGWFVLRAQGVYAAMLTLAFAQILWSVATQWVEVTGGDNGILGVWPPAPISGKAAYYGLTLLLALASLWLARRAAMAPFGFSLRAVRDAPARAAASGIDSGRVLWAAFAAGGVFAGLAGVLNAYQKGSVFPNALAIAQSLDALVMVLAGGLQTLSGPIVGSVVYHGLVVELTRGTEHWRLLLGGAIVVLAIAFPQGIAGFLRRHFEPRSDDRPAQGAR